MTAQFSTILVVQLSFEDFHVRAAHFHRPTSISLFDCSIEFLTVYSCFDRQIELSWTNHFDQWPSTLEMTCSRGGQITGIAYESKRGKYFMFKNPMLCYERTIKVPY